MMRDDLAATQLQGRAIQTAVGKLAVSPSQKMTAGYARYAAEYGRMEPHRHAEELCYILDCKDAWVRFGPQSTGLEGRIDLRPGMLLHIPEMEFHVFEYGPEGYAELLFYYGQIDNIRPEEKE